MKASGLADLLARASAVLRSLGLSDQEALLQIAEFISGPPVVGVRGSRAQGKADLIVSLETLLGTVRFQNDGDAESLQSDLVDAVLMVTPCDAALSLDEVEAIRALRTAGRPTAVVVADTEQLGEARIAGQEELSALRLGPLLTTERVPWCFTGQSDPPGPLVLLVRRLLDASSDDLHVKPAADALAHRLERALGTYDVRCKRRDEEREILRRIEAQVPLDLAQFSETEKVERLRARNSVQEAFERLLLAADETGGALSVWVCGANRADSKSATSAFEAAWEQFRVQVSLAPLAAVEALQAEGRRLEQRLQAGLRPLELSQSTAPVFEVPADMPEVLTAAGGRLVEASIRDLIDVAVELVLRAEGSSGEPTSRHNPLGASPGTDRAANPVWDRQWQPLGQRTRGVIAAMQSPAQRASSHLVRGVRSRVELPLKAYLDGLDDWLRATAESKVLGWERIRRNTIAQVRAELAERHGWSPALADLEELLRDLQDLRRTVA